MWLEDRLERTLLRELAEELGIFGVREMMRPGGAVVDHSSLAASRHVAIVFEMAGGEDVDAGAGEEFALRSAFSGTFLSRPKLRNFEARFDLWSRILSEDFGRAMRLHNGLDTAAARQLSLPVFA